MLKKIIYVISIICLVNAKANINKTDQIQSISTKVVKKINENNIEISKLEDVLIEITKLDLSNKNKNLLDQITKIKKDINLHEYNYLIKKYPLLIKIKQLTKEIKKIVINEIKSEDATKTTSSNENYDKEQTTIKTINKNQKQKTITIGKGILALTLISGITIYNKKLYKNENIKKSLKIIYNEIVANLLTKNRIKNNEIITDKKNLSDNIKSEETFNINKTNNFDIDNETINQPSEDKDKLNISSNKNSNIESISDPYKGLHKYISEHFNIFNELEKRGLTEKYNIDYDEMVENITKERLLNINKYVLTWNQKYLENEDFCGLPDNFVYAMHEIY